MFKSSVVSDQRDIIMLKQVNDFTFIPSKLCRRLLIVQNYVYVYYSFQLCLVNIIYLFFREGLYFYS